MMFAPLPVAPSASTLSSPPSTQANPERASDEARRSPAGQDLDALGMSGYERGRRQDRARGAVAEAEEGGDVVLGLHPVQPGRRDLGGLHRGHPDERAEQVERVDRLSEQDAAAVAGHRAAPGLVVVALRPPPGHRHGRGLDGAERTARKELAQAKARRPEAMLQRHAEPPTGPAPGLDQALAARDGELQRLLDEHVLAGREAALGDIEMGCGRGQDQHRVHSGIGDRRLDVGRGREGKAPGEVSARSRLRLAAQRTSARSDRSSRLFACGRAAGPSPTTARPILLIGERLAPCAARRGGSHVPALRAPGATP